MEYTSRLSDNPSHAHVNYQCPCGCTAGVLYDRVEGSTHLGMCCCGRLLWVGGDAEAMVRAGYEAGAEYVLDRGSVTLPWGEEVVTVLAVPKGQLVAATPPATPVKVRDVVCNMMIDPGHAAATSEYRGETYYFCATVCKNSFDADPSRYVKIGLLDRFLRK
jgi:YHS domain-containing protein